jgi:2-methylcitrate dehydratase PrpD
MLMVSREGTANMGLTTELAGFVAQYPAEEIPDSIVKLAKRCFINFLGVALHASRDPSIDILLKMFDEEGGTARASVVGRNFRTNLQNAAMANGYLGHLLDYDDTHYANMMHASSPIFPACLAVGETTKASGKDFLAAYVLGLEAACRIGSVVASNYRETASFWHITSICGVFGAAAAAGRLLKLRPEAMAYAFGIAGTQASGLRQVFGSMRKPFHTGHAAKSGLLAALLAQRGFTSTDNILEGKRGFIAVMAKDYDLDTAQADLGKRWELPMIGIKPYACGVGKHGLIDAMLSLRSKDGISLDNIESITGSIRAFKSQETLRHPTTGVQASFSYHHSMAVALLDGAAFPDQYSDEKANDPLIASVRDRINVVADPDLPRGVVTAAVVLKDGRQYEEIVEHPTGSPERPMTDTQVEEKFRALSAAVLAEDCIEKLLDPLWQLEKVADVSVVTNLINGLKGGRATAAGLEHALSFR